MTGGKELDRDQREFNRKLIDTLERLGVEYAVGGSMAAMLYSEIRSTRDIDVMLRIDLPKLEVVVNEIESWQVYIDPFETLFEFVLPGKLPINVVDGKGVSQKHPIDISKMLGVIGKELDTAYLEQWAKEIGVLDLWLALWDEFHTQP